MNRNNIIGLLPFIVIMAVFFVLGAAFNFLHGATLDDMFYGVGRAAVILVPLGLIVYFIALRRGWPL